MSLINCPDCKNSVSDNAVSCPHCGYPIKNQTETKPITSKSNSGCLWIIIAVLIFTLLLTGLISKSLESEPKLVTPEIETVTLSKEDSIMNVAKMYSINKQYKIEEKQFLKTKAGKIYKKHPNWSKEDCKSLAKNNIWIGMEYEMVVYLRGKPNDINTSNYGSGLEYQACWDDYNPGCFYFSENHIITSYN
jgi:hypothetical protein